LILILACLVLQKKCQVDYGSDTEDMECWLMELEGAPTLT